MLKRLRCIIVGVLTLLMMATFAYADQVEHAEDFTDDCADFTKVYSNVGFEQSNARVLTESAAYGDENAWQLDDQNGSGEIVYKAADGKIFSYIRMEFSRSGNSIFPKIEYRAENGDWQALTDDNAWNSMGGGGAEYFNHAIRENRKTDIPVEAEAKYVRISVESNGGLPAKENLLIRKVELKVSGIGYINEASYHESFSSLDYTYSNTGITIVADGFAAAGNGEIVYMAARGSAMQNFNITVDQGGLVNNVTVKALDRENREIAFKSEITESWSGNVCTLSGDMPEGTRYIALENTGAVKYTAIGLTTKLADTFEWISSAGEPTFTVDENNLLTVTVGVTSEAGIDMEVNAYLVIYENDVVKSIQKTLIPAISKTENNSSVMTVSDFGENQRAELFIMSDIKTGFAIGDAAKFSRSTLAGEDK